MDIRSGDINTLLTSIIVDFPAFLRGERVVQLIPPESDNEIVFEILLTCYLTCRRMCSQLNFPLSVTQEESIRSGEDFINIIFGSFGYECSVRTISEEECRKLVPHSYINNETMTLSRFHPFNLMTRMSPVPPSYQKLFEDSNLLPYVMAFQRQEAGSIVIHFKKIRDL